MLELWKQILELWKQILELWKLILELCLQTKFVKYKNFGNNCYKFTHSRFHSAAAVTQQLSKSSGLQLVVVPEKLKRQIRKPALKALS